MRSSKARRRVARAAKRLMDVMGACAGLVLLSPVLALVAIAVLATQGRPILFRQLRPGLHARPFEILKFRTMRSPRTGEVWYMTDEQRITRLGRCLRSTSIDELPELCRHATTLSASPMPARPARLIRFGTLAPNGVATVPRQRFVNYPLGVGHTGEYGVRVADDARSRTEFGMM